MAFELVTDAIKQYLSLKFIAAKNITSELKITCIHHHSQGHSKVQGLCYLYFEASSFFQYHSDVKASIVWVIWVLHRHKTVNILEYLLFHFGIISDILNTSIIICMCFIL